ncbi:MFS general substrate transporter [Microstroma glucosiphilum]|uniref:MFS general substrate transporter n=1 Tax=Pseudomicrostroma glucosiphilum TaxID=1684307 RepID=A0A316U8E6_9BASI|nr:MFS general substrate transporter [Pseudomicrostroma glucosiphilum]PWN21507.1 MFS general substrate transporter [Pseudomicrostroma glucosiphilum]
MSTFFIGGILGRRLTIIVGSIWMLIGAIIQTFSSSVGVVIFGRIVSGIGMGLINASVPVYQAEMSPALSRGQLVAIDLVVLNCGIALSYWCCYGFNFSGLQGNVTWRVPIALQCVFIVGIFLIALILPDTPRWYATRNRNAEALTVLARLRGKPEDSCEILEEFNDIQATILHEAMSKKSGWLSLVKPSDGWKDDVLRSRRRLFLACFIQAAQQLGGINALIYYSSTLFSQSLKFGSRDSAKLAGGLNMVLILGSLMSIFLVDRVGRRKLLLPCIAAMSFVFVLQTIFVKNIQAETATTGVKNAAVAMLFFFELFFSIGFQATVWMIPSEILPLNIRTQGSALSTGSNWVSRTEELRAQLLCNQQLISPLLSPCALFRSATSS